MDPRRRDDRDNLGIVLKETFLFGERVTLFTELQVAFRAADLLEQHVACYQVYDEGTDGANDEDNRSGVVKNPRCEKEIGTEGIVDS
jgi:hypothetical protein